MWGFSRRPPEHEPSPALIARLDALEDANRRLEKAQKGLEVDWSEWFNKFRLLYARLSKRVREDESARTLEEQAQEAPGATISPPPFTGPHPHRAPQLPRRNY